MELTMKRNIDKKNFADSINKLAKQKGIDKHLIDKRKLNSIPAHLLKTMLVELHLAPKQK